MEAFGGCRDGGFEGGGGGEGGGCGALGFGFGGAGEACASLGVCFFDGGGAGLEDGHGEVVFFFFDFEGLFGGAGRRGGVRGRGDGRHGEDVCELGLRAST